jgi:hypothetical protein
MTDLRIPSFEKPELSLTCNTSLNRLKKHLRQPKNPCSAQNQTMKGVRKDLRIDGKEGY